MSPAPSLRRARTGYPAAMRQNIAGQDIAQESPWEVVGVGDPDRQTQVAPETVRRAAVIP